MKTVNRIEYEDSLVKKLTEHGNNGKKVGPIRNEHHKLYVRSTNETVLFNFDDKKIAVESVHWGG